MSSEPAEPSMLGPFTTLYKGRSYYDTQDGGCVGSLRAERDYLRDWKAWAERQIKGLRCTRP